MTQPSTETPPPKPNEIGHRLDRVETEITHFDLAMKREPLKILDSMDEIARLISAADPSTSSLQAERSQFEQQKASLMKRAGKLIKAAGGAQAFIKQREQRNPPVKYEWWYLDVYLKDVRKKMVRKTSIGFAVGISIFILLFVIYRHYLSPDPKFIARLNHQNAAISALLNHQYQQGLNEANLALANDPADVVSLDLEGMALMKLGQVDEANQVFLRAQASAGGMENFLLTRSLEWIDVNEPALALDDAQKAVGVDAKSVEAYWYRGKAEVLLGQYSQAEDDFNQAITLANQENQMGELGGIKADLADLMQSMQ